MTHKPDYWLAWQAIAQVTSIIYDSDVLVRSYANNALQFIFYDYASVQSGVLNGMEAT
jgi:hypothetical protein